MRTTDSGKGRLGVRLRKAKLILDQALNRMLEINKQLKKSASEANSRMQQNLRTELKLLNRIIEQQASLVRAYEMQLGQL